MYIIYIQKIEGRNEMLVKESTQEQIRILTMDNNKKEKKILIIYPTTK